MNLIDKHHIKKNIDKDPASNFELLLAQAIEMTQHLTGQTWTDYNLHDPGITILEQVCFAITDLAYKTDFPIEDLLTDDNGSINRSSNAFFDKQLVLTNNPVTINDLRKAILDKFDEVDNVMLIPIKSSHSSEYIKGLYEIIIRLNNSEIINQSNSEKEDIAKEIIKYYLGKRNLSEDISSSISILKPQKIELLADITIKYNSAPEEIFVEIINKLESVFNPKIRFYSEKELLQRGMKTEEIYCGPLLKNGFIPDDELKPISDTIDPIELTNIISQIEGVIFVKKLLINDADGLNSWKPFKLDKGCYPSLDISFFSENVKLFTDDYKLNLNQDIFKDLISRTEHLRLQKRKAYIQKSNKREIKQGKYRNPGAYYSIQNNFPIVYGIGREGLSSHESEERKAAARQLKSYLLFFEQIMANYSAQLENLSNLYSTIVEPQHSYYYQPLYGVPRVHELLNAFTTDNKSGFDWSVFMANPENNYIEALKKSTETPEMYVERKERVLDHLLARFNTQLNSLPILHYFNLYVEGSNRNKALFLLQWKADVLKNIVARDSEKVRAFNYLDIKNNLSGFERNVAMYLNLNTYQRHKLTSVFDSGNIAFLAEKGERLDSPRYKEDIISAQSKGEVVNVISGSDEILSLGNIDNLIVGGIHHEYGYIFRYQKINILKYGINIANYKIVESQQKEYLIIYKAPEDKDWMIISRRASKEEAIKSLDNLISYLRKISIDSEGFYIMEHILLRPELNLPAFGFRFRSSSGETLFQYKQWNTFDEREAILARLKRADVTEEWLNLQPITFQTKRANNEDVAVDVDSIAVDGIQQPLNESELQRVIIELQKAGENSTHIYPRFEFLVKLPDGTIIEEDFYNLKVTIALPAWPARFQDNEFRMFTENLLRSIAPAYLRLDFRWLGISRMKKFENIYFQFIEELKKNATSLENRYNFSADMISWLTESYTKKQS